MNALSRQSLREIRTVTRRSLRRVRSSLGIPVTWPVSFFVLGAGKSGTTSLHNYLASHPKIFMTKVKEPNFFAFRKFDLGAYPSSDHEMIDKSITDLDAYLALFDGMKSNQLAGESSPIYFYHPTAAASIGKAIPWAKFFLILRDPANRAWSDYQMHVREGRERRAFLDAIEEDRETFRCYIGSYLEKSEYGRHLSRYLEHFSQDRFRIWLFDELQEDPERLVQEAIEFIGLDGPPPSVIHRQFNVRPSRQPELPREARRRLIELLRPDVELLESLLHRDLGQWLK